MTTQKSVLITGAGSGIGRALAIEAGARGFDVIIAGRTEETLRDTAQAVGPARCEIVVADVTIPEGRRAVCDAVGNRLDVLINNAGTLNVGHLSDLSDDAINRMVSTNLAAPMALTRDLLPHLKVAGGRVVNIGSVFGDIAYPFFATYSATKFGLRGFSDAIRRELSGTGIGVTYIAPRATRTAAEAEFGALVEPLDMTLDSADRVATEAWDAIAAGRREAFPRGKERFFVKVQRLLPSLVDRSVGAQARNQKTLTALAGLKAATATVSNT